MKVELMQRKYALILFCALITLNLCLLLPGLHAKDAKLKVEDIVAGHLASIGTPEARANIQSRLVGGTVNLAYRIGASGEYSGKINILSEGRRTLFAMNFSPFITTAVQVAFDGNDVAVGQVRPGVRSTLSQFIYENNIMVKEGLLGGTLSTAWPLLDLTARQAKLNYNGLKKIEGMELHEVKYRAKKGGGDMEVYLYFDPNNFRHVRTRYHLVMVAMEKTVYTLVEQFDNFGEVDGLTLPQKYRLEYSARSGQYVVDWDVEISQIMHNQQIDPQYFTIK